MLHVVCFSHKRQLQLHGYLASLAHYLNPAAISVIYPPENEYETVRQTFPCVAWTPEHDFNHVLQQVVHNTREPYIMFGCDDVTFVRQPTLEYHAILTNESNILGYSLRLGSHIEGAMSLQWKWPNAGGHWAYPFELTGTIYRTRDIQNMLMEIEPARGPNHFEYLGWQFHLAQPNRTELMRGVKACLINQNVNQVQNTYNQNSHHGTACTTLEQLDKQYANGRRLDWKHAAKAEHHDVWTGMNFWKLTKSPR